MTMKKLTLLACACLLLALHGTARADPITLRFDELPPSTTVHGRSVQGVAFDFRSGGVPSADASYNAGAAGLQRFVQCPCLEGNAAGTLTLSFAAATPLLRLDVARFTPAPLSPGVTVELFDPASVSLGVFSADVNRTPPFTFAEGQFSYSGVPVSRAVITFNNPVAAPRFAIDNLSFEPIPEPATLLLLGTGLAAVAVKVRHRRKARKGAGA